MKRFFRSRSEQDQAIRRWLESLVDGDKALPASYINDLDGSDHAIIASIVCSLVDVWIAPEGWFQFRISPEGRVWLVRN